MPKLKLKTNDQDEDEVIVTVTDFSHDELENDNHLQDKLDVVEIKPRVLRPEPRQTQSSQASIHNSISRSEAIEIMSTYETLCQQIVDTKHDYSRALRLAVDDDEQLVKANELNRQIKALQSKLADVPVPEKRPRARKVFPPTEDMFAELIRDLQELRDKSKNTISQVKELQTAINRRHRDLSSKVKKQKSVKTKRKPTGFAKPDKISQELLDYLTNVAGLTNIERIDPSTKEVLATIPLVSGCLLTRNEVIKALSDYFKKTGFRKNKFDQRKIYLDTLTTELLDIDIDQFKRDGNTISKDGEPIITYQDLQKLIVHHCGKNIK